MKDADYIYVGGWLMGFTSAIASVYLLNRYFPDLLMPRTQTRVLIVRKEDTADASLDASDGMARRSETRTDA